MARPRPALFVAAGCALLLAARLLPVSGADEAKPQAYADPKATDADFPLQGEYLGEIGEDKAPLGVHVIALGSGKFHAVGYHGGLPGAGWNMENRVESDGEVVEGAVTFASGDVKGVLKDGKITISDSNGAIIAVLSKTDRTSPTLGMKPPEGAVVLFDGTSAEAFENGKKTEDGLLQQGVTSKQKFGDCTLHLEFRLPYMPAARGQSRGNSGLYLQGRYEVQMLDSFGLTGENNECGGIYTIKKPDVNMCLPPLVWQTYDIDYTAAKFDADGKKTTSGRMTVRHNGVVIHDNVELTHATTAAPLKEGPEPGPIYLQDHGNPVRYRNIWILEKAK